jgi:membrane protease YdiL (CAAX protease family)
MVTLHLFLSSKKQYGTIDFSKIILFQEKLPIKTFLLWTTGGILACLLVYLPMYPVGIFFRENLFSWLPEWYFNPSFGASNSKMVANVFLLGIFIDGIVGPVAEELFFRGYLLPRMAYLKKWAPIVNGAMFGLYHFWQPHNFFALMAVGIILSYVVWKKRNVYLGIAIHCSINIAGAVFAYMAALDGTMIGR